MALIVRLAFFLLFISLQYYISPLIYHDWAEGKKREEIFQIVVFYPKKSFDSNSPCSEFHSISNGTKAKLQNNIKEGC